VEPFLLADVKATIIGDQLFIAELPGTGIIGVALWFGPGQKFLSRFVMTIVCFGSTFSDEQRNAGGIRQWRSSTMPAINGGIMRRIHYCIIGILCLILALEFLSLADTVLPEHQKKGYGMALMSAVEQKVPVFHSFPTSLLRLMFGRPNLPPPTFDGRDGGTLFSRIIPSFADTGVRAYL
jgi:GNAT superfamily N-acetyltransferase